MEEEEVEIQEAEEEEEEAEEGGEMEPQNEDTVQLDPSQAQSRPKRARVAPQVVVRETGKTLLPLARVQRIMKADKQLPVCAKEATILIAIATEEFIKRLILSANAQASREKRNTVSQKDIAVIVKKQDELLFLEEIIPIPEPIAPRPRVAKLAPANPGSNQTLSAFMDQGRVPQTLS